MRLASVAFVLVAVAAACTPASERCIHGGGDWRTPVRDPGGDGVCVAPAADEGKACRSSGECAAHFCECPGNPYEGGPNRVADGTAATGTCARFPARGGAGWMCTVEDGVVHRQGIIVD